MRRTLVLAIALLLALSGCVPAGDRAQPSPSASATPAFASDEEALAAAEKAYAAYLKVSDEVAQSGWTNAAPLASVARGAALRDDKSTASSFAARSLTQLGQTSFDSVGLESVDSRNSKVVVTFFLCVDVSQVDVQDPNGTSVVSPDRKTRVPIEVDADNLASDSLKISRNEAWSGTDFC